MQKLTTILNLLFMFVHRRVLRPFFKIFLFAFLVCSPLYAVVGDRIENQASIVYTAAGLQKTTPTNRVETLIETLPATIEFLAYDSNGDQNITLSSTRYLTQSNNEATWYTMPPPQLADTTVLSLIEDHSVREGEVYASSDLLIVRVLDVEANQDIDTVDTLEVTLSCDGDAESIKLKETANNSGVFIGYTQLTNEQSDAGDGKIYVSANATVRGEYLQSATGSRVSDTAQIAPDAKVFLSESGQVLSNVEVMLLDAQTREVRYRTVTDENGVYSFPHVEAGNYILYSEYVVNPEVEEGSGLGGAYLEVGYKEYSVEVLQTETGSLAPQDISFEREEISVWLEKRASKARASKGEFIEYTLVVHNDTENLVTYLQLEDNLPRGLKYKEGSLQVEGTSVTPQHSEDGLMLFVPLNDLVGKSTRTVRYIAEVTAGIEGNTIINKAWLRGNDNEIHSNIATSEVAFDKELFSDQGVIMGQVMHQSNNKGLQGVRLYMEDGTYVITDHEGQYHIEEVALGMHVLQVDTESLLDGYAVVACQESQSTHGSKISQFVEFHHGGLKRVDFCVEHPGGSLPTHQGENNVNKDKERMPDYTATDITLAEEDYAILWPREGYIPSIPSTKLAVMHPKGVRAVVYLNGSQVSLYNYDTTVTGKKKKKVAALYKGVDLLEGGNLFEVKFLNKNGKLLHALKRKVHVSGAPMSLQYHEEKSTLLADGKTTPTIAVQFFDAEGYPLREGIQGTYQVEAPNRPYIDPEVLANNPLSITPLSNRFTIEGDGIAYIKLHPTTRSGEARLSFTMDNQEIKQVKAWLKPQRKEWILVGFAQGSIGYQTFKKHQEATEKQEKIHQDGRIAFFAKGKVKGEWILSMAYDSGKKSDETQLDEAIDPNQYYMLYGDASEQYHDASSQKKLYLKIEKSNFYALFGNFQTGLTTTELSQYHRTMQGLKSEYHDKYLDGSFFVSKSEQMFQRDELPGDGTSGFYHLSHKGLIMNSEVVTLEVRDRYRNEIVLDTKTLHRYQDYEIDYVLGRLYFKQPIYQHNEAFNPNYIVVEYELSLDTVKSHTYGGRFEVKPTDKIALGSSYVNEDMGLKKNQLMGVDARVEFSQQTTLHAEYARTDTEDEHSKEKGSAKYLALEHVIRGVGVHTYYREQEGAFGLGQLSTQLGATRKMGLDLHKRFARWLIEGSFYRDERLDLHRFDDVAAFNLAYSDGYLVSTLGYRYIKSSEDKAVNQITMMISRSLFDHKLRFTLFRDQTLGATDSETYPTRTAAQVNYNITSSIEVFGTYEMIEGEGERQQARAGIRVSPWQGSTIESSQVSEFSGEGSRVYTLLGMQQQVQVSDRMGISAGYEKATSVQSSIESEDFEAYNLGMSYHSKELSGSIRAEMRNGAVENKRNLQGAVYTQRSDALALALGARYVESEMSGEKNLESNSKLALAYRPQMSKWTVLSQLAYVNTLQKGTLEHFETAKLISNNFINYRANDELELLFSYGLKHVLDSFGSTSKRYQSYIDFVGLDLSYAFMSRFDMGFQGAVLHSYKGKNQEYSAGAYLGYNLFDNSWLRAGYNAEGFSDDDFSLQNYHRAGPYIQFNMKFDQESLKKSVGSLVSW